MSGRRRTGAAASAVTGMILKDRERRLDREEKVSDRAAREQEARRAFAEKLALAGIKAAQSGQGGEAGLEALRGIMGNDGAQLMPGGAGAPQAGGVPAQIGANRPMPVISPIPGQVGAPGAVSGGGQGQPFDINSLPEGVTVRLKIPGGTVTIKKPTAKPDKEPGMLSEGDAQRYMSAARPGTPFPSNAQPIMDKRGIPSGMMSGGIPYTDKAVNTLQRGINQGRTESPAATMMSQVQESPEVASQVEPQAQQGILQQIMSGFQGLRGGGRKAAPAVDPNDPIAQRIQQLRQSGMPDDQIAAALEEKGVDPSRYGL